MILTTQLRYLKYENVTLLADGTREIIEIFTLQQWFDPDPLKGELVGAWLDVPVVITDKITKTG